MTHIDLFSGIGGFALACEWNGIETEVFCEKDERCRGFLQRTYPGVPVWDDIRTFDGTKWRGRFLLTAGVPCQPASRAGKQRGKDDDRWLWPEALRVVSEARPDWVLFENPLGINDVGLDGILADLEGLDYEVAPPLIIPACAVNSPQLRNRYWIVGHRLSEYGEEYISRNQLREESGKMQTRGTSEGNLASPSQRRCRASLRTEQQESDRQHVAEGCVAHSLGSGRGTDADTRVGLQDGKEPESPSQNGRCDTDLWGSYIWLPCADGKVRRAPDDSFGVVDGLHRSVLGALGNSIVPQVAAEIIRAIVEVENETPQAS